MRRSLSSLLPLVVFAAGYQPLLQAQTTVQQTPIGASRFDFALGYQYLRANAPPAQCGCFDMSGGFASAKLPIWSWLSAAVEVTGGHARNISPLGQDLTLTTYTAGPRVTLGSHRITPYAQALVGAAHASDSYFPNNATSSATATSFAFTTGGGVDLHLNRHLAVRLVEAQYLHTGFPNGSNNEQNHLTLGAGVVFKFGKQHETVRHLPPPPPEAATEAPPPPPPPPPPVAAAPVAETAPPSPPTASIAPQPTPSAAPTSVASIQDIFFDTNSNVLRPDAEPSLAQATSLLQENPGTQLELAGYADARGSSAYNLVLGKQRARNVQHALLRRGVRSRQLKVLSHGKNEEVCSTQEESCWQRNRRVVLTPKP